jgi:uncharacterized membrane protein
MEAGNIEMADHPVPVASHARGLPLGAPFGWLGAGWRDLMNNPMASIAYGLVVFVISVAVTAGLVFLDLGYILFPAIAAFMVVGPLFAVGLYQKSSLIEAGERPTLGRMLSLKSGYGGQIGFIGVILLGLALLWMRSAVILYALFFGLRPFPGFDQITPMLFTTPLGWMMLATGTVVGGLFAAFAFAISAFSIPMLLDQRTDAFTAMGTSMAIVWTNGPIMIVWGAVVAVLTAFGLATGFLGLIVVFPLLGHATWHAWRAVR